MKRLSVIPAVLLVLLATWALVTKLQSREKRGVTLTARKTSPSACAIPKKRVELFQNPAMAENSVGLLNKKQTAPSPPLMHIDPMPVAAQVTGDLLAEVPSKSPFDFSFLAAHAAGKQGRVRDFSEFLVGVRYHIDDKTAVAVGQEAKKLYEIAAVGEDEFLLGDTRLFLNHKISPDFLTFQWDLEVGATLPVSHSSRNNKHITRPHLALRATRSFFKDLLTVGYSPFVSYSFNQYATDKTGQPLQKIVFGQGIDARIAVLRRRLYVKGWAKGYHRTYEEFDFSTTTPGATQSFDLGSALDLVVTDQVGLEAGITRGTSVLSDLRYDSGSYDSEQTRVFAAIKVSL